MFVCVNARLDDQFEFVQGQWLNDGGAFGLGCDPDVVAGQWRDAERQVLVPGAGPPHATTLKAPIVTARGGAYVVVPSIRGLWFVASGDGVPAAG
jgi:hypothetical protein